MRDSTRIDGESKKQLRPGLDAIIRWLGAPRAAEDIRSYNYVRIGQRAFRASRKLLRAPGRDGSSPTRPPLHRRLRPRATTETD